MSGLVSFVIPVRNEAESIRSMLEALSAAIHTPAEILIVYDEDSDPTLPVVKSLLAPRSLEYRLVRNTLGRGPANALRAGFAAARGEALIVMMADRSDDPRALDPMMKRFAEGYDLVVGSRYMSGGEQIGGPWLKGKLSRIAGRSLEIFGLPICDPTNSFKLYRTEQLRRLSLDSAGGFEINLEDHRQSRSRRLAYDRSTLAMGGPHPGTIEVQAMALAAPLFAMVRLYARSHRIVASQQCQKREARNMNVS